MFGIRWLLPLPFFTSCSLSHNCYGLIRKDLFLPSFFIAVASCQKQQSMTGGAVRESNVLLVDLCGSLLLHICVDVP